MECVRLRVQDVDFERGLIVVRAGKGYKDRATLLPSSLHGDLQAHLLQVQREPVSHPKSGWSNWAVSNSACVQIDTGSSCATSFICNTNYHKRSTGSTAFSGQFPHLRQ
jgi:integrase